MQAKGWWFLSLAIVAVTFTANADSGGAKLLDDVIRSPGSWNQMCSIPETLPYDVPFPLYTLAVARFYYASPVDISRLEAQRGDVVASINERLHNVDRLLAPFASKSSYGPGNSNQDPSSLSGLLLEIIMELKAVETIPELLRVEAELNQRIEKADKDINAPLPNLNLDSPVFWQGYESSMGYQPAVDGLVTNPVIFKEPLEQQKRLFVARVFQRELLSVVATLLRQQQFQPLLNSDIEAHYAELRKSQGDGYPVSYMAPGLGSLKDHYMPYTPELRREIRGFAAVFLKQSQDKHDAAPSNARK